MNIGNPNEFTIRELAEAVLDVTGSTSEIVFEPLPVDDPTQRQPDITLAREVLGWEPQGPAARRPDPHLRVVPQGAQRVTRPARRPAPHRDPAAEPCVGATTRRSTRSSR